jgi:hypothetical protein
MVSINRIEMNGLRLAVITTINRHVQRSLRRREGRGREERNVTLSLVPDTRYLWLRMVENANS